MVTTEDTYINLTKQKETQERPEIPEPMRQTTDQQPNINNRS